VTHTIAILAGADAPDASSGAGASKALLSVGGVTSLERVLSAVDRAAAFDRLLVVGPRELEGVVDGARLTTPAVWLEQGGSLVDNMRLALSHAAGDRLYLVAADVPLITPAELDRFAQLAEQSGADVAVGVSRPFLASAPRELTAQYRRSAIIARDGPFLLANMFAVRHTVLDFAEIIQRARGVRRQSGIGNMVRAFAALAALGLRAVPTTLTWLRLVLARALWLRGGQDDIIPAVAPTLEEMERAVGAITGHELGVRFMDIGADGACFDIDDSAQHELISRAVASAHGP
jgi:molybdopterin-guanine dinucleotide biosynthesis protein A